MSAMLTMKVDESKDDESDQVGQYLPQLLKNYNRDADTKTAITVGKSAAPMPVAVHVLRGLAVLTCVACDSVLERSIGHSIVDCRALVPL